MDAQVIDLVLDRYEYEKSNSENTYWVWVWFNAEQDQIGNIPQTYLCVNSSNSENTWGYTTMFARSKRTYVTFDEALLAGVRNIEINLKH